jgi:hypothetical protein
VRAIVIYESLTGNTRIDYQALSEADLVVVGSWVDGLFVVGQRPGRVGRIAQLPALAGKRAIVYLTYALHPGKALQKLSDTVAARGADVLGGVTIRRDRISGGVEDLVDRILDAVAPA